MATKSKVLIAGSCITLVILAVLYGMAVEKYDLPPNGIVKALYHDVVTSTPKKSFPKEFLETPPEYWLTDVAALISIKHRQDVFRLRKKLITFLWGKPGLPSSLPAVVNNGISDTRYDDINSLARIDKLTIKMEYGLESIVYHFIPKLPNNKVVLYHAGHDQDFYDGKLQIKKLLDAGYSVLAFAMPLSGMNSQPTIQIPKLGRLKLTFHDEMKYLVPKYGHPVKYFIEPVVIALNYLKAKYSYASVSMVGFSGGGWTATLAAAVDTRIEKSFPVAGSLPIYLRSNSPRDWDDYEQTVPELYRTINYLDLYILGSYGSNRMELQVLNQYDPCCFAGTKSETYKSIVRNRVRELGSGEFDIFLDTTQGGHKISDVAMSRILEEIGEK